MAVTDPQLQLLLKSISLEEKEQEERFSLNKQHTLKSLKAEGLALHPIHVTRKSFGYADYPEVSFRLAFPAETHLFKDGAAIECFLEGQEAVKGVVVNIGNKAGEFRLYAPDFPDWIEEGGVGIKLAPDQRTTGIMKDVLQSLGQHTALHELFQILHYEAGTISNIQPRQLTLTWDNPALNESQQRAVSAIIQNESLMVVHGPPGTGKTTTLVEGIFQLIKAGEKVLVAAPSNTAVDHLAKGLIARGVKILRVGNASKADEMIYQHTPEGRLNNSKDQKAIKELKIRAEQFRRMALKYKRSFGKAEREQRNLLFKEVKNIRTEIRKLQDYNEHRLYEEADVVIGTPIGLYDASLKNLKFNTLVIDEAGQCIEPLAWCIFPLAEKYVLAGDHLQLPPTVLSNEAARLGLNKSILEWCVPKAELVVLLDTQYRMRQSIAGFSSNYFYSDALQTPIHLANIGTHITFIDTAGSGYQESSGANGSSLQNEGEINIILKLLGEEVKDHRSAAVITPYSGQVALAVEKLSMQARVSTIDSFQGQEMDTVLLSLVRSNEDNEIGFLKDYRRMNVALTRAKNNLYVIGDSATIAADPFYHAFLNYVERYGAYRTVWEFDMQ